MLGIGAWELTLILVIILVLFGGKRLPAMATGLGQAIRNFRGALKGDGDGDEPNQLLEKNLQEKHDHTKVS